MPYDIDPIAGNWYEIKGKGQKFEVVAVDEDSGMVEIQYFDGDLEEIDIDAWSELDLESIEPPEDWTGPMDDIERDDLDYTETDMESEDWRRPLRENRRRREEWQKEEGWELEEEEEEEEDEWSKRGFQKKPWDEEG